MPRRSRPTVVVIRRRGRPGYYLRYRNSKTGEERLRAAGTTSLREAEREAGRWLDSLLSSTEAPDGQMAWEEFKVRYLRDHLSGLAERTSDKYWSVLESVSRDMRPGTLAGITPARLASWFSLLRDGGRAETTIAGYSKHLHAALVWAVDMNWLAAVPKFPVVRRAKVGSKARVMKGRPLSDAEFERMLNAVSTVVGSNRARAWRFFLRGLWTSGLRLEESLSLSWDDMGAMRVDLSEPRGVFRIPGEVEKGHRDRVLPMAPEFCELLQEVPEVDRHGCVFRLPRAREHDVPPSDTYVSRVVTAIGRAAGLVVAPPYRMRRSATRPPEPKYASAHDLRRSFGTRWAKRVLPQVLQQLMRHENIQTTMRYYVDLDAQSVAQTLWDAHQASQHVSGDQTGDHGSPGTQKTLQGP